MTDDTTKAAVLWLLETVLGHVPVGESMARESVGMSDAARKAGMTILARARHERDYPEDRG